MLANLVMTTLLLACESYPRCVVIVYKRMINVRKANSPSKLSLQLASEHSNAFKLLNVSREGRTIPQIQMVLFYVVTHIDNEITTIKSY